MKTTIEEKKSTLLDDKVTEYINWYNEIIIRRDYKKNSLDAKEMRNFIEKMAVWYELRYPDYTIIKLMANSLEKEIRIPEVKNINLAQLYNPALFMSYLSLRERNLLQPPKYNCLVYLDTSYKGAHLHLSPEGLVEEADNIEHYTNYKVKASELKGLHIKEVAKLFQQRGILDMGKELVAMINNVDRKIYQQEEMLNCVMYRIIERGGRIIGPRRAFLFAQEFNRDMGIALKYGIDLEDKDLRSFINEYLNRGGDRELECYINYFNEEIMPLSSLKINDILKITESTKEEIELQKRLVSILKRQINAEEVKEEIKNLRIARKLKKKRN